ncbi:MAG TPA: VTT domain-containing protein, partial [Vicinamibacterales bacterium]
AARHSVFILGWDIFAEVELLPGSVESDVPTRLDELLAFVARRRKQLRCYILIWDYAALYTLERDPFSRWRLGWRMPRGVRFGFDDHHPVGASHHQKIVVVDDRLAFCGGIDLTGHRWDTCAHRPDEPLRVTPQGTAYEPYHEVQAMVSGPVAASLGELARDRWRALGAEGLPPVAPATDDLWPGEVVPDLENVAVGISRTMPGSGTAPPVRECEALFLDSIAAARQAIYVESQYFTNETLSRALATRLAEPDGPEVIVITPKECHGWLEKTTMGAFRDSVFRELIAGDAHRRLRVVYPAASRERDIPTFIHSKVMIVDDEQVRIGSANFSHRSMGVDTECDLTAEAGGRPAVREGIRHIRNRLLAEHLGMAVEDVEGELARAGSLRELIDRRADGEHTLLRIELPAEPVEPPSAALRAAADPDEPVGFGSSVEQLLPPIEETRGRSPLRLWILPGLVLVAAAAVARASASPDGRPLLQAVRDALGAVPWTPESVWIGAGVFVLAGLLLVPLELLAIVAGLLFGWQPGALIAATGAIATAIAGYIAGRAIGTARLPRWMSRRSYRSGRQIGARGFLGVVALRLASVASAGAINLLSGAWRIPFAAYVTGSVIGLLPPMLALAGLGALLRQTFLQPSIWNGLMTIGAGVLLILVAAGLRALLLIRQFAPSVSSHSERAEFG